MFPFLLHLACYQLKHPPFVLVYNKAAWKPTIEDSVKLSSISICIPKLWSGLTFGKDNKSVDRTKKFPWNVLMLIPLVQRSLITASKPIGLVRYRLY